MKSRMVHRCLLSLSTAGLLAAAIALFIIHGTSLGHQFPAEDVLHKGLDRPMVVHPVSARSQGVSLAPVFRPHALREYDSLPLSFEPNEGQTDAAVRYVSHGAGYTLLLTANEAVLSLAQPDEADRLVKKMDSRTRRRFESRRYYRLSPRFHRRHQSETIRVTLAGASTSPNIEPSNQLLGTANYFIGRDRSKWRTGIRTYGKIEYSEVLSGNGPRLLRKTRAIGV
jgi:hypothetical protein